MLFESFTRKHLCVESFLFYVAVEDFEAHQAWARASNTAADLTQRAVYDLGASIHAAFVASGSEFETNLPGHIKQDLRKVFGMVKTSSSAATAAAAAAVIQANASGTRFFNGCQEAHLATNSNRRGSSGSNQGRSEVAHRRRRHDGHRHNCSRRSASWSPVSTKVKAGVGGGAHNAPVDKRRGEVRGWFRARVIVWPRAGARPLQGAQSQSRSRSRRPLGDLPVHPLLAPPPALQSSPEDDVYQLLKVNLFLLFCNTPEFGNVRRKFEKEREKTRGTSLAKKLAAATAAAASTVIATAAAASSPVGGRHGGNGAGDPRQLDPRCSIPRTSSTIISSTNSRAE